MLSRFRPCTYPASGHSSSYDLITNASPSHVPSTSTVPAASGPIKGASQCLHLIAPLTTSFEHVAQNETISSVISQVVTHQIANAEVQS